MEPVDDRTGLIAEELKGQTDLEDWVWNDCDLQSGNPDEDEDE